MSKYSFFVFVAHAPVLLATWIVYRPLAKVVPYPVYWLLAPVVTTAVLVVAYRIAMRIAPNAFSAVIATTPPRRPGADGAPLAAAGLAKAE